MTQVLFLDIFFEKDPHLNAVKVFLAPGTWDAVIQISCPLAQSQMSFASLLQKAEMVPLFLQKAFKQKKAACNSREFMWHLFAIQFHPPPISVT